MALDSSRDHISLEWSGYVLALQSSSKIDTVANGPPKRGFPEDTMQIKIQVYLATLDCTSDHFHIVIFRGQESSLEGYKHCCRRCVSTRGIREDKRDIT